MIKLWKSEEQAEFYASPLGAGDLVDIFNYIGPFYEGYFATLSDLEQFAKECFEAARENTRIRGYIEPEFKDFPDFWAERKEKLGK